jgi:hypothetical protein
MNKGVLTPKLVGRKNLHAYYAGVAIGENFNSLPQGGFKKRKGTKYLHTLEGLGRSEPFVYSTEDKYLVVFTNGRMEIFKNRVLVTSINPSTTNQDYLPLTWLTTDVMLEMDYIQSVDTIIITHKDVPTKMIQRTTDTEWTEQDVPFTNIPKYDYRDDLSPNSIDCVQEITFENSGATGDRFKLSLNGVLTEEITFAKTISYPDDNTTETASAIERALYDHPLTESETIVVTHEANEIFIVTFSDDNANDWELLVGTYTASTASPKIFTSFRQEGKSSKEDSWGVTRGYPRKCTFHEARFWIGGTRDRTATIFGSNVNSFWNFDKGRSLDDNAVEVTLDTDQANPISAIFSNRKLQVFTSGQEFYCPISPITPEKVSFPPQTNVGAKEVRPVTIDGVTLFVQETGKAIIQFLYVDESKANQSGSISFTAEHLFENISKMSVKRGESGSDANYVYFNSATSGKVVVFNTLLAEEVAGFTEFITGQTIGGSDIIDSTVLDHELYHITERVVAGTGQFMLEVETEDCFLDASVTQNGLVADEITELDHLEGEYVAVMGDGVFVGWRVVSGGRVQLPRDFTNKSAGLSYFPRAKGMPLTMETSDGMSAYKKKKIVRLAVELEDSNGVVINGRRIPDKKIGINQFDAVIPFTGTKLERKLGWTREAQWEVTQMSPYGLTLLAVGMEVKA